MSKDERNEFFHRPLPFVKKEDRRLVYSDPCPPDEKIKERLRVMCFRQPSHVHDTPGKERCRPLDRFDKEVDVHLPDAFRKSIFNTHFLSVSVGTQTITTKSYQFTNNVGTVESITTFCYVVSRIYYLWDLITGSLLRKRQCKHLQPPPKKLEASSEKEEEKNIYQMCQRIVPFCGAEHVSFWECCHKCFVKNWRLSDLQTTIVASVNQKNNTFVPPELTNIIFGYATPPLKMSLVGPKDTGETDEATMFSQPDIKSVEVISSLDEWLLFLTYDAVPGRQSWWACINCNRSSPVYGIVIIFSNSNEGSVVQLRQDIVEFEKDFMQLISSSPCSGNGKQNHKRKSQTQN